MIFIIVTQISSNYSNSSNSSSNNSNKSEETRRKLAAESSSANALDAEFRELFPGFLAPGTGQADPSGPEGPTEPEAQAQSEAERPPGAPGPGGAGAAAPGEGLAGAAAGEPEVSRLVELHVRDAEGQLLATVQVEPSCSGTLLRAAVQEQLAIGSSLVSLIHMGLNVDAEQTVLGLGLGSGGELRAVVNITLAEAEQAAGLGEAEAAWAEEEGEVPECWICRETGGSEPLIHPCSCRGSMSGVHATCVEEWVAHHRRTAADAEAPRCSVCHQPYQATDGIGTPDPNPMNLVNWCL